MRLLLVSTAALAALAASPAAAAPAARPKNGGLTPGDNLNDYTDLTDFQVRWGCVGVPRIRETNIWRATTIKRQTLLCHV
jgi:hypothetical protein